MACQCPPPPPPANGPCATPSSNVRSHLLHLLTLPSHVPEASAYAQTVTATGSRLLHLTLPARLHPHPIPSSSRSRSICTSTFSVMLPVQVNNLFHFTHPLSPPFTHALFLFTFTTSHSQSLPPPFPFVGPAGRCFRSLVEIPDTVGSHHTSSRFCHSVCSILSRHHGVDLVDVSLHLPLVSPSRGTRDHRRPIPSHSSLSLSLSHHHLQPCL